jgi:hypothetical protein
MPRLLTDVPNLGGVQPFLLRRDLFVSRPLNLDDKLIAIQIIEL